MKRSSSSTADSDQDPAKKIKINVHAGDPSSRSKPPTPLASSELGEDLILEILKKSDARTLARAACASRRWKALVADERVWEAVCTRHWASIGCGAQQMRSVVLALGGFKRLHSAYLLPLLQPASRPRNGFASSPAPPSAASSAAVQKVAPARWGKDEVQLSMALLSIGYFEKMNRGFRKGGER